VTTTANKHYHTRLEINGVDDVPVRVTYLHVPFRRGSTDGRHGPKLEPDQEEHIEIEAVEVSADGRLVELTTAQDDALEEEVGEWLAGMYDPPEPEGYHDE
jgi:hypothetical protein